SGSHGRLPETERDLVESPEPEAPEAAGEIGIEIRGERYGGVDPANEPDPDSAIADVLQQGGESDVAQLHLDQREIEAHVAGSREMPVEVERKRDVEAVRVLGMGEAAAEVGHPDLQQAAGLEDAVEFLHDRERSVEVFDHMERLGE